MTKTTVKSPGAKTKVKPVKEQKVETFGREYKHPLGKIGEWVDKIDYSFNSRVTCVYCRETFPLTRADWHKCNRWASPRYREKEAKKVPAKKVVKQPKRTGQISKSASRKSDKAQPQTGDKMSDQSTNEDVPVEELMAAITKIEGYLENATTELEAARQEMNAIKVPANAVDIIQTWSECNDSLVEGIKVFKSAETDEAPAVRQAIQACADGLGVAA